MTGSGEHLIRLTVVDVERSARDEQLESELRACESPALGQDRLAIGCMVEAPRAGTSTADAIVLLEAGSGEWAIERAGALRGAGYHGAVAVVSGPVHEHTVRAGLGAGAHAWHCAPLQPGVFAAQVRSLVARLVGDPPGSDGVKVEIGADGRTIVLNGTKRVRTTPRAFEIFVFLLQRRGHFVTQGELIAKVFRTNHEPGSSAPRVHVAELRNALGPEFAWIVQSADRLGYRVDLRTDSTPARLKLPHRRYRGRS